MSKEAKGKHRVKNPALQDNLFPVAMLKWIRHNSSPGSQLHVNSSDIMKSGAQTKIKDLLCSLCSILG